MTADRWRPESARAANVSPTFAVGMIREEGVPDTLRIGGVLTDMLATNLARVAGLSVLANARLFELMRPGQDTLSAGYYDAARRAGANEIFQGRLLAGPQWSMAMEMQRVDLTTGIVKSAYRVAATDRYGLIDSMTAAIARDLRLGLPSGSVADATTESPMAYRLYEEGLRAYYQYDAAAALRLMQSALKEDSMFAMAAYYDAILAPDENYRRRERALRLAARAPERERLHITAEMLLLNNERAGVAVVESLTTKYPNEPRGHDLASRVFPFRETAAGQLRQWSARLHWILRPSQSNGRIAGSAQTSWSSPRSTSGGTRLARRSERHIDSFDFAPSPTARGISLFDWPPRAGTQTRHSRTSDDSTRRIRW